MSDAKQTMSVEELIKQVSKKRSQASWRAISELARRALDDENLLDTACTAISGDRARGMHYVPVGSYLAVNDILSSNNENAIRRLLREMDSWSANEQEDALSPLADFKPGKILEAAEKLTQKYGWKPKYLEQVSARLMKVEAQQKDVA